MAAARKLEPREADVVKMSRKNVPWQLVSSPSLEI
jgi:hypothetical protein